MAARGKSKLRATVRVQDRSQAFFDKAKTDVLAAILNMRGRTNLDPLHRTSQRALSFGPRFARKVSLTVGSCGTHPLANDSPK